MTTIMVWIGLLASAALAESADEAFHQAQHALQQGEYDRAITRLDEAVRLEPRQAKYVGMRGVAFLKNGEYAKGAADLKAAMRLNSGDAGLKRPAPPKVQLSAEVLRHGRRQVEKMLGDRPAMADFAQETDFLRQWAARKFAGEDLGTPIDWDRTPPLHSDAEHLAPSKNENAAILVAAHYDSGPQKGRPRSFEELWAGAIYELHNVVYAREFVRLHDEAEDGIVSKRDFVAGIVKYELCAAQQTRAFYLDTFLPWAAKKKLPTDPTLWFCDWWVAPETVLQGFPDSSAYPWRPYGRDHDWATVRGYWRHGRFRKALRLLQQMRTEKGYDEDQGDLRYWIGRCREQLDKATEKNDQL